MINEESLKAWEQDHIEFLTSREMGEWLYRRDKNRDRKENPQGEWLFVSRNCWKCPYCQELTNEGKNFCPNCGAKMKGGAE